MHDRKLTKAEQSRAHWISLFLRLPEEKIELLYSSEAACRHRLKQVRWPHGPVCPKCSNDDIGFLEVRKLFRCLSCKAQFSLTSGTLLQGKKVSLQRNKRENRGGKVAPFNGRDHHGEAFTMWMAGGGVKPGITYGETDEFGYFGTKDRVHVHDLQATILHQMGIDHEQLTYRFQGRNFRLTDVHGHLVKDILS